MYFFDDKSSSCKKSLRNRTLPETKSYPPKTYKESLSSSVTAEPMKILCNIYVNMKRKMLFEAFVKYDKLVRRGYITVLSILTT